MCIRDRKHTTQISQNNHRAVTGHTRWPKIYIRWNATCYTKYGSQAPGEDGITGSIHLCAIKIFPQLVLCCTVVAYKLAAFQNMEERKPVSIIKPSKEHSIKISGFRAICLLNLGGKVLEKVLRNRKVTKGCPQGPCCG